MYADSFLLTLSFQVPRPGSAYRPRFTGRARCRCPRRWEARRAKRAASKSADLGGSRSPGLGEKPHRDFWGGNGEGAPRPNPAPAPLRAGAPGGAKAARPALPGPNRGESGSPAASPGRSPARPPGTPQVHCQPCEALRMLSAASCKPHTKYLVIYRHVIYVYSSRKPPAESQGRPRLRSSSRLPTEPPAASSQPPNAPSPLLPAPQKRSLSPAAAGTAGGPSTAPARYGGARR